MSGSNKAKLRELSDAAFGQQYRLECMLAIAADLAQDVSLTELAQRVGLGTSQIQGAFKALVDVGLLVPKSSSDRRRKVFQPTTTSSAWKWAREIAESVPPVER